MSGETLLKNGRGYGVTFLAVWNRALYQQSFQKQAVQLFLSYQTGVHLGGKLDAQRAIETGLSITEQARIRPPETGFALEGTRLSEVYLPRCRACGGVVIRKCTILILLTTSRLTGSICGPSGAVSDPKRR